MKLLLDTHVLAWWLTDRKRLSHTARDAIEAEANEVLVSVLNAWEMAIKVGQGKWPEAEELLESFESEMTASSFSLLPITISHVRAAGLMQSQHRDPFDRLLATQANIEGLTLVTGDPKVQALVENWLW